MAYMTLQTPALGTFTFTRNPRGCARVRKEKVVGSRKTLTGNVVFNWQFRANVSGLAGLRRTLYWPSLPIADYNSMRSYYESAETVRWDPKDKAHAALATYDVQILALNAHYWPTLLTHMRDVEMVVQITAVH